MKILRPWSYVVVLFLLAATSTAQVRSQVIQSSELETYLQKAKVTKAREIPTGLTIPRKLDLDLNGVIHSGVFKFIDENVALKVFEDGTKEPNFQDSYLTEIAAYEVDKIIGLGMVPTTVERKFDGKTGSLQFFVDSEMTQGTRLSKNITPPDATRWNRQWEKSMLFDNLIYNMDRNQGNLLINKDWEIILIDHSRSFRTWNKLKDPTTMPHFSESLLEGLGRLNETILKEKTGKYLSNDQRKSLLKRRDLILELAKKSSQEKGTANVLYP